MRETNVAKSSNETNPTQPENGILFNGVSSARAAAASQSHRLHPTKLLLPTIASLHLSHIHVTSSECSEDDTANTP